MFTIEHDFDATIITLIDEGQQNLSNDITICAFEDCITIQQDHPITGERVTISLSITQLCDLAAALNLPEGSYRRNSSP